MHVITLNEYINDLKRYLSQYIHSSKNVLNPKLTNVLANDREELFSYGIIHNKEGQLMNDTQKYSKIAMGTFKEAAKGFFTYGDNPDLVSKFSQIYFEPYHSQITMYLDGETRSNILKIVYHFSFLPYHPWKNKIDVKLNNKLYDYNINVAYIQFKALWTSLYNLAMPTHKATEIFQEIISNGTSYSSIVGDMHVTMTLKNTLNFKSKIYDYGEFDFDMILDFTDGSDPLLVEEKKETPEELYYRYLAS